MAVKILERLYNETYTDGETDWLLGNVGEWQKLKLKFEVGIDCLPTQGTPIKIDYINNAFVLVSGENWGDYGFDTGMNVVFKYKRSIDTTGDGNFDSITTTQKTYSIKNVFASTMEVVEVIFADEFDSVPANFGSKKITDVLFYVSKGSEGCRIVYGHVSNADFESTSLNSIIDGTESEFAFSAFNTTPMNVWGTMEAIGKQSGMSIRVARVREIPNPDMNYKRHYEIELQYMISSLFEDITNFENMELPSFLTGDGSLTDNFKIEFYPEWNNPNVKIQNDMTKTRRLGNTGWFEENFNELRNDFLIDSVKYFDTNGNPVETLDYSSPTKVQITISGVPNLNNQTECGFGFSWIPTNEDDYKNKETPFYRNCFVQSGDIDDGFSLDQLYPNTYTGAGVDGGSMDASKIRFSSVGGKIIFEATMTPNTAFFNMFDSKDENDRNFIIWVSVADGQLVRNFSDRVALLADFSLMEKNIPPAGKYDQIENSFIEHPFDETSPGETSVQSIVQDDILCRMPLRIPTDGSKVFERITFGIEAFNIGTGESFDLERYEIDLNQFPITTDGVQQLDIDTTRGFKLEPGNNKNWVKIQRDSSMDTANFAGFMCYYGFKVRWEDWILKQNVPADFFKQDALNKGSNNDWVDYFDTSGWVLKFFSEIISNESGDLLEYKNQWDFDVVDYDKNENIAVTHKYFRDSDDTLLNIGTDPETGRPLGVIISNEPTRIEIEFEILDAGIWDILTTYAVITIEIDKGAGIFEQRQLSSVWGSENDNPLKPVTGETLLKIEVDGTNKFLKASCLVDPDLLDEANRYRVTGRVGCIDDGGGVFDSGLYEFRYEETYE